MIKLIVIDLDGTLLNDNNQVTSSNTNALLGAIDKGVKVVFASGRSMDGILRVIKEMNVEMFVEFMICFNGAKVINPINNLLLTENHLNGIDFHEISQLVNTQNLYIYGFDKTGIFTPRSNEYSSLEATKNKLTVKVEDITLVDNHKEIYKIVIAGPVDDLNTLEENISEELHGKYSIVRSHTNNLEFLHPLANKGHAMRSIVANMGISLEEVMAIGDAGNDIEMVKIAGVGIAMGNGFSKILDIADDITDTNNNSGVAKAIQKYLAT